MFVSKLDSGSETIKQKQRTTIFFYDDLKIDEITFRTSFTIQERRHQESVVWIDLREINYVTCISLAIKKSYIIMTLINMSYVSLQC